MKGTLQTFINAFTYPDKTIYPVASQVRADFSIWPAFIPIWC